MISWHPSFVIHFFVVFNKIIKTFSHLCRSLVYALELAPWLVFICSFLGKLKIFIWFVNQNLNSSNIVLDFFIYLIVLNISIRLVRHNDHFHEADKVDQAFHCFFWSFLIEPSKTSFCSKFISKNLFFSLVLHLWSLTVHALSLTKPLDQSLASSSGSLLHCQAF